MNKFRDVSGFINLNLMNIKNITKVESYDGFSFTYEGIKYYFKRTREDKDIYNEMIAYEIAQDFGIEAIPYDIASYDGEVGYLSKDFFNRCMVYLEDILINYYGHDRNKCNLDHVCFVLEESFPKIVKERIEKELIELLMFDLIISNPDRHDRNIIIDMRKGCLAPIFDNELMLNGEPHDYNNFCFTLFAGEKDVLSSFLSFMDDETIKRFVDKIEIINSENIIRIIKRVENKIGAELDSDIKEEIINKFIIQYNYLQKKVKNIDRGRKLKLSM